MTVGPLTAEEETRKKKTHGETAGSPHSFYQSQVSSSQTTATYERQSWTGWVWGNYQLWVFMANALSSTFQCNFVPEPKHYGALTDQSISQNGSTNFCRGTSSCTAPAPATACTAVPGTGALCGFLVSCLSRTVDSCTYLKYFAYDDGRVERFDCHKKKWERGAVSMTRNCLPVRTSRPRSRMEILQRWPSGSYEYGVLYVDISRSTGVLY